MNKLLVVGLALSFSYQSMGAVYKLDKAHTDIGFTVKHLMVSNTKGQFKSYEGQFDFDSKKKEVKGIEVTIDTASIDTGNADRDKHLKNDDFFNVEKFPKMTFKSDKAVAVKEGKVVKVPGTLTIRDKSQPVTLDVTFNGETEFMGTKKVGFTATTKVNRKDFGVSWNKTLDKGGLAVADEVKISIEGEADMDAPKPAQK